MAQSRRNDLQRPLPSEPKRTADAARVQGSGKDENLLDGLDAGAETLDVGHAHLRSECWGALRQRLLRPARRRTRLHLARPAEVADARLTSPYFELLDGAGC